MEDLIFEKDNHIGVIRLNRPESLNAFSVDMIQLWIDALEEIKNNDDIYVGILTGNGKAFCAGGDIKAMINGDGFMAKTKQEQENYTSLPLEVKNSLWKNIQKIPLLMEEIDKPMIAAINGAAIGAGLDMALMCDIRFCSDEAKLGEGYIKAGIVPGDGGGYYLPRIIGIDNSLEMLWTGKKLTAAEAKEIGLVTHVIPNNSLLQTVKEYANNLCNEPQEVIQMMKRIVYQGLSMNLKQSLDMASSLMAISVHHPNHKNALEKLMKK
ncbi:enoyl-CoA hydratase/isomerase family protein [Oceanobacillus sp. M60]|uniref:enoyl-CoA hydratase/isomerase family protein n=1 Tax=Oceanobacillus sp. FSL K6-0251 TaxID=2921602 RepID=UPI0030FA1CD1